MIFIFNHPFFMDERGVLMVPPLSSSGNSKQTRSRRQGIGRVDSPGLGNRMLGRPMTSAASAALVCLHQPPLAREGQVK